MITDECFLCLFFCELMKFRAASESIMDSESDGCRDSPSSVTELDTALIISPALPLESSRKELEKCWEPKYSSWCSVKS